MTSEMAIEDIEEMQAAGLKPTPRDIIRLNALALKVERSFSSGELYRLPRVSYLGKLTFREPTIGHGIWIDAVSAYCDGEDAATRMAVEAFAMSRRVEDLPDAADRASVVAAIDDFTKKDLAPFVLDQIGAAVSYARDGADATAREYPAQPPEDGTEDAEAIDILASVGVGTLFETLAIGLGVSVRDVSKMTISMAKALQEAALATRGIDLMKNRRGNRVAEYMATKNEIIERLKGEVQNG